MQEPVFVFGPPLLRYVISCRTDTQLPLRRRQPHLSVSEFSAADCAGPSKCKHCPIANKLLLIPGPPSDILRVSTWGMIVTGCSEFRWIRYNPAKIIEGVIIPVASGFVSCDVVEAPFGTLGTKPKA